MFYGAFVLFYIYVTALIVCWLCLWGSDSACLQEALEGIIGVFGGWRPRGRQPQSYI